MSDLTPVQAVDNCIALLESYRDSISAPSNIIKVKNGDDLQKAHDAAFPGDILLTDPGDYLGLNISKSIGLVVNATIPDVRVQKAQTGFVNLLPRDANSSPLTIPGNKVNLVGVKLSPCTLASMGTLTGDSISLDKCQILGDPVKGQRRGLAFQGSNLSIVKSYIDDIFANQDAQTIEIWNGAGPFLIDDCYLSASGETVLSGGADSDTPAKQPSHLTLTNSTLTKNTNWHSPTSNVKNVLELKDMISATIRNNIIENSWLDGQTGYLLLITPRNQDGLEPFAQVAHILIENNIIRNGGAGIQILGSDNEHPSQQTIDVVIQNNQFDNIGTYPGDHKFITMTGIPGAKDVKFIGNKCTNFKNMNSFLYLDTKLDNLIFTANEVFEGEYGLKATGGAPGIASWNLMVTNGSFTRNTIHKGGFRTIDYGPDNVVVP